MIKLRKYPGIADTFDQEVSPARGRMLLRGKRCKGIRFWGVKDGEGWM